MSGVGLRLWVLTWRGLGGVAHGRPPRAVGVEGGSGEG